MPIPNETHIASLAEILEAGYHFQHETIQNTRHQLGGV
jgi:hypothetical protein